MTTRHPPQVLIRPEALTRGPSPAPLARPARSRGGPDVDARGFDVGQLFRRLRRDVSGEVRFDSSARRLYAQDASNYRHVPLGVVVPRSADDVLLTLAACREVSAPVVSRTGGTALAGQAANEAVVIDFSKYMNRILELDPGARQVRVEPGVICDRVVEAARPYGLTWGPKPATHDHCCFGGMIANNCGGMHAQYAGIAVHNVEALDVVLYDGTRLSLGWLTTEEFERRALGAGREGEIFARLHALAVRHAELIRRRFPKLPRRVSGYNLDQLLPDAQGRLNLARALVGTEGTCAITLGATLRLVDDPPERLVVALGYDDIYGAADHVPEVLGFEPLALEGMDRVLYDHVRDKHMPQRKYLGILPPGNGWLLVELGSHDRDELARRARHLCLQLLALPRPPRQAKIVETAAAQAHLWKVREAGLGATAFVPGRADAWPGFEDSAVAPERLGAYLRELRALFDRYGYEPALYGHFGAGCVHCRVAFDLASEAGLAKYRAFMHDAVELCAVKYGGSISGEHGDGQARGELLYQMFGEEVVGAFREFKSIWDPDSKMNPGRVVDARPFDQDLRLGPDYAPWQPETHFRFPDDGGSLAHATLRCVGVGKCRRHAGASADDDTMCPSFMVTREEKHSTRGRAHLLWEMMRGATATDARWRDKDVKEALDLCLSCKGCKGDCPVNVDVATYKAEFLAHYHDGRLRPRHTYAFGFIDRWARLAARAPGLVNLLTQLPGSSSIARFAAGMTPERKIPSFAPETFRAWFARREPRNEQGPRVLLWPDTFNNYFYPETARAAVQVLEQLGFAVAIPREILCCGRPLYDYGLLPQAKQYLERVLSVLAPELELGTPIVVLEPSCCAVFRDELPALLPERIDARKLCEQALPLSELIARRAPGRLPPLRRSALVQGHCHHKAIMRFDDESAVLDALELDAEVLASGCCGLAGSFGFERDKYDLSRACGERVLFPRVREASDETLIIADGFSCRTQIEHGTGRRALHLAEVIQLALHTGPEGPVRSERPEAAAVARRERAVRRSMWRAAFGSALAIGAVLVAGRRLARLEAGAWR